MRTAKWTYGGVPDKYLTYLSAEVEQEHVTLLTRHSGERAEIREEADTLGVYTLRFPDGSYIGAYEEELTEFEGEPDEDTGWDRRI